MPRPVIGRIPDSLDGRRARRVDRDVANAGVSHHSAEWRSGAVLQSRSALWACVAAVMSIACSSSSSVSPSSAPTIMSLQPLTGPVGTRVTITGTGFSDSANTVNFGANAYPNIPRTNATIILFVVPTATNPPCRNVRPPCAIASMLITPGVYGLSVTSTQGTSNSVSFAVTAP
jgi:hypothetical protein